MSPRFDGPAAAEPADQKGGRHGQVQGLDRLINALGERSRGAAGIRPAWVGAMRQTDEADPKGWKRRRAGAAVSAN